MIAALPFLEARNSSSLCIGCCHRAAILTKSLIPLDGGAEGSRTPDLLIANETLYQLSYDPITPAPHWQPDRRVSRFSLPWCSGEKPVSASPTHQQVLPGRQE